MKRFKIDFIAGLTIAVMLLALIFLNGCLAPQDTGTLKLSLDTHMSRTLLPGISMDVTQYNIQIVKTSDSSELINETVSSGDTLIYDGILPDDYTVTVIGLNDNSTALGEGDTTVTVNAGETAAASVTVVEYDGTGTLDVDVTWSPDVVTSPVIESSLKYGNETAVDISADWTLGTLAADYLNNSAAVGFHTLVFKLYDSGVSEPAAGFATLARIAKDQTTQGVFDITANAGTGGINIDVTLDFYQELTVNSSEPEGSIDLTNDASPLTITLTPDTADTVFYVWYRNGVSVDSTSSFTIDPATLTAGNTYRYDAIAITADGKSGASLSWTINCIDINGDAKVTWTPAAGETYNIYIKDVDNMYDNVFISENLNDTVTEYIIPVGTLSNGNYVIGVNSGTGKEFYEEAAEPEQGTVLNYPADLPALLEFGTIDY